MAGFEPIAAVPRLGRVLAAFLALCLLAELFAQITVFGFAGERFRSLALYKWSAYGLVRNNPDLTSPAFKINPQGFRSLKPFSKNKPPGTFRIMLLGGSVLYSGIGGAARLSRYGRVSSGQTIANYLEAAIATDPAFAGRHVEVINGAVNYNRITESSASYLAEYIHWQPDFVIVFGTVNNFATPRRAGDLAKGLTDLQRPHPWYGEFSRMVQDNGLPSTLERLWRTGGEHSAALALSTKVSVLVADQTVALAARAAAQPPPPELPLESPEERARYFNLFATYADAMIAASERQGTGIAFVWEPMLSDLGGIKPLSAEEASIFKAVRRPPNIVAQYDATRKIFVDHFARRGIPAFDPTDILRRWDRTVFIDYGHYTPDGNRFVAEQLYAAMGSRIRAKANGTKTMR